MLLDSNIIIYAAQLENEFLREFIAENSPFFYFSLSHKCTGRKQEKSYD
ncbi:hypothetical protein IQ224_16290 [Microcystis sp. LEGE 00066]|jgi:hypothetical protein|uniref:PIN domain-containing protein n=1 Tax=Microcystis aeruginosa PCC 7806SL TaxID=1903187 RepID=A0AB33BXV9_MICA7|nr:MULTISPECIES: hypothetical protein [Microcystis]MCZ8306356.1 hypothetical protein [Microcystis sp. LE19-98.1E]ARI83518.1 hypothetical protein BH695_4239 [Microcystis aeruginosa PCC 7806SL]ELS45936.1 hypothetical protein C789_4268 [Microcystis aeruginosa FACHB-905 = DIANCHI905]MBE9263653.1 hypothetical protein [Microcystis sp. LEGE 00066]MCA2694391.1 hypothetical protein [Microcystis sp. M034S2]